MSIKNIKLFIIINALYYIKCVSKSTGFLFISKISLAIEKNITYILIEAKSKPIFIFICILIKKLPLY